MLQRYCLSILLAIASADQGLAADAWKVGLAKVVITPEEPTWLSGYSHRTHPAEGKVHDLYAKAAAFESAEGTRLVLVTFDLGSVNPRTTENVAARVEKQFQLPRSNLVLNCSHTHCAPEIALERRVFHKFSDEEEAKLARYLERLSDKLVDLIGRALADLQPAELSLSRSEAKFAFNRRHPSGIDETGAIDRDVPVLRVTDRDGKLRAVIFGYACHNTTLNFQLYCGDYAGFAQYRLEESHPGAMAMFVMGCGGDQNPQPRHGPRGLEYAEQHGHELAESVEKALAGEQRAVRGPLSVAYDVATLHLEPLPPIEQLRAEAKGGPSPLERKARYLLGAIDSGQEIPLTQPCPLHVARFGDDLLWIFISGETVVDFSLRCKVEFAGPFVWVTGYCDDVFAYLPSRRVLQEGGYEGRTGVEHQLMATPFQPDVEQRVMDCLRQLVTKVTPKLSRVEPREPADAVSTFRLQPGFRIEQVAAEPLVHDPVAMEFDENGRAYVIELSPYNHYATQDSSQRGKIRCLEDVDGDGRFDRSTVFAADLHYPTGLFCYDGGLFVGDAPDLLFLKDTDGDGRADKHEVVLTGFGRDHAGEGQLNSFRWGLDNRIHLSTGLDGGEVRAANDPDAPPRSVRNHRLAFDPRTSEFNLTSGGGQHGLSFDDWGRAFVCDNSDPARLLMYEDHYLSRNPRMIAPPAAVSVAPQGKYTEVFRISPVEPWRALRTTLRTQGKFAGSDEGGKPSGFFTAGTGVTIYRGNAWPEKYYGNLLVGEAANNVVYRAQLESDGIGMVALRADAGADFVASTDNWFRPVQFANAPDGTLYVLDMYRELIEGAAFLPPAVLAQLDPAAGSDRGRIYRIVPDNFQQPAPVPLGKLPTANLVALLEHRNGWHRETAARLLYQRQDAAAVEPLRKLAAESRVPQGRVHALYALSGLEALSEGDVLSGLSDKHPRVREHAVRLSERFAATSVSLQRALTQLADDPDPCVRFQLAFTVGVLKPEQRDPVLVKLLKRDGQSSWFQMAAHSSLGASPSGLFGELLSDATFRTSDSGRPFLAALARQMGLANQQDEIRALIQAIDGLAENDEATTSLARTIVVGLLESRGGVTTHQLLHESQGRTREIASRLMTGARETSLDEDQSDESRAEAIHVLGFAPFAAEKSTFQQLLEPRQPQKVQEAALAALGRFSDPDVADLLLTVWTTLTPRLRSVATEVLLSRSEWAHQLLGAIKKERVPPGDIDSARVALLQSHPDASLRSQAAELFVGIGLSRRTEVLSDYQQALKMTGDLDRGRIAFRKVCAGCHRLEGVGTAIGADLQAIRDRGREAVMLSILDPNREVKPQFLTYVVITTEGQSVTGMISEESTNSLTIHRPDGTCTTLPRSDIEEMRSSGLSFMPEGLEKQLNHQTMADLLTYLSACR